MSTYNWDETATITVPVGFHGWQQKGSVRVNGKEVHFPVGEEVELPKPAVDYLERLIAEWNKNNAPPPPQTGSGGSGWDAVIHLDGGIYSSDMSGITIEGMSLREIYQAMMDGKQPRVCVYNNAQYGVEHKGVSPVLSIIAQSTDPIELEFQFIEYMNMVRVQMGESETGDTGLLMEYVNLWNGVS